MFVRIKIHQLFSKRRSVKICSNRVDYAVSPGFFLCFKKQNLSLAICSSFPVVCLVSRECKTSNNTDCRVDDVSVSSSSCLVFCVITVIAVSTFAVAVFFFFFFI